MEPPCGQEARRNRLRGVRRQSLCKLVWWLCKSHKMKPVAVSVPFNSRTPKCMHSSVHFPCPVHNYHIIFLPQLGNFLTTHILIIYFHSIYSHLPRTHFNNCINVGHFKIKTFLRRNLMASVLIKSKKSLSHLRYTIGNSCHWP